MNDIYVQAQGILSDDEKTAILGNFTKLNPHWDGAYVADVLSELHNTDAHCGELEELYERLSVEVKTDHLWVSGLLSIYIHGKVDDDSVKDFAARLRNKHGSATST